MKKSFSFLVILLLIFSCTTSNDSNGNSTTAAVPLPPTNLTGNVISTTQINLSWTDNSTNEIGFKIERRTGSGTYVAIGMVNTDGLTFSDVGLTPNTTYVYRLYSYNLIGNSPTYSNEITLTTSTISTSSGNVTDIDGNVYSTVIIGTQCWMQKNLNVSKYRNGDLIPQVTDPTAWKKLTTGAWCYYENSTTNGSVYGKLYNWYAVHDSRGLAPVGWHVPSNTEWTTLINYLGGENIAGEKMKETGTAHWQSPNTGATNSSGFTALPGGCHNYNGSFYGIGWSIGIGGYWWSSSEFTEFSTITDSAWGRGMYYNIGKSDSASGSKFVGFSVRCLKD